MSTLILLATTAIIYNGQSLVVQAGESVADSGVQAAISAVGGTFAPATDANVVAAVAVVTKMRSHGANEADCSRVMAAAAASTAYAALPQHLVIDVPLATITAQTSAVAFNVGAALPANAKLMSASIQAKTPLSGGSAGSAHASLNGTGDGAGSILGTTNVFTGCPSIPQSVAGSNPYPSRGGQQLQMVITGDGTHALSTLTAGDLQVDVTYFVSAV